MRDRTSSLAYTRVSWVSTVRTEAPDYRATSALVSPRWTSRATRRSAVVRVSHGVSPWYRLGAGAIR